MQVVANGTINGLMIALLAAGFSAVYIPTRVFYIALGGIYAAVPYVARECLVRNLPLPMALMAASGAGVLLSVLCELANHAPLERRKAGSGAHMVASIGAYIVIVQAVVLLWGTETKVLWAGTGQAVHIGEVVLNGAQALGAVTSIALLAAFGAFLRWTGAGLRFRAVAENALEFALRGHSVRRARVSAFALSGLLASTSSLLVASDIGFDPHRGLPALLPSVVATIVGGRMSFMGAVAGGIILGIVRSEVVWHMSARWQEPATFLILIVFMLVRPEGIFSRDARLEARA